MEQKKTILIVDDEPEFLEIFGAELRAAGYEVETAASGAEGLAMARKSPPVLILMDVQMPGMNGVEALMQLKGDPATKDIKVLFLTNLGNADPESVTINNLASQDIRAEGYVKKTGDLKDLVAEIRKHVA